MRRPSTIRWDGPEGFGVEINEDGVHLTKGGRPVLDPCDLTELLGVITDARSVWESTARLVPRPPSPKRRSGMRSDRRAVAELRDARRSLADQIEQIQERGF